MIDLEQLELIAAVDLYDEWQTGKRKSVDAVEQYCYEHKLDIQDIKELWLRRSRGAL